MTFHAGRTIAHQALCVPTIVRHACASCQRQRLPGHDQRGGIRGQVIDASVLRWNGSECPMQDKAPMA